MTTDPSQKSAANPLASTRDDWTGDPETDRANLINRARAAIPPSPAPGRQSALPCAVDIILTTIMILLVFGLFFAISS